MSNSLKTKGVAAKNPAKGPLPLDRFKSAPTVAGAYTVKHVIPGGAGKKLASTPNKNNGI